MSAGVPRWLERFRRPEYTGENRCTPCTIVNLVLGGILATVVGVSAGSLTTVLTGTVAGLVAFGLAVASIALRGYLVPGTPWITKTYFPDRVLRWFEKEPPGATNTQYQASGTESEAGEETQVELILAEAGAVTDCEEVDDLCLTDEFRTAWRKRIDELRDTDTARGELATVLDVPAGSLVIEEHGSAFVAHVEGQPAGQWESEAAFLADVAAARELRSRYAPWSEMGVQERSTILDGLRLFLEECPACGGEVELGEDVVESCCRSMDVVAVTCQECGSRLFEAQSPG